MEQIGRGYEFRVGDFVWGKIHGHLWWPGKICSPSDASEKAVNSKHPDHYVLVAYFTDTASSWCEPSELRPFKDEFQRIVDQNSSHCFISAVKDAINEVERCLRSDMTCYCVPPEIVTQFRVDRYDGAGKPSISNYTPSAFLAHLQVAARDISVSSVLDVAMLRSWAASFYLRNGCFVKMIEDLFDEKQTGFEALPENFQKDKERVRGAGGCLVKRPFIAVDEASRKKRSMAELILLTDTEMQHSLKEDDKLGTVDNEFKGHIIEGLFLNQKKKCLENEKEKARDTKTARVVHKEDNGFARRERKMSKYLSPPYTTGYAGRSNLFRLVDSDVLESDSDVPLHMHSKYSTYVGSSQTSTKEGHSLIHLSEYIEISPQVMLKKLLFAASNPLHMGKNFPAATMMEFLVKHRSLVHSGVLEHEIQPEKKDRNCDILRDNLLNEMESNDVSLMKKSNERNDDDRNQENVLGTQQNRRKLKKDQATTESTNDYYCLNGVDASTGRSRNRGKRAAVEIHSGTVEKSDYRTFNNLEEGKLEKKKSKSTGMVSDSKIRNTGKDYLISSGLKRKSNVDFTNGEYKTDFDHIMYDNSEKSLLKTKRTKHANENNENSAALLLTFSSGSTLPSKEELMVAFVKYGALIKQETELFRDTGCARVVFARAKDAKKALNGVRSRKHFPFVVVDCQSFHLPQCSDIPSPSPSNKNNSLLYISRDLQRLINKISPKNGPTYADLKPEVRADLINDISGLLSKVKKLIA